MKKLIFICAILIFGCTPKDQVTDLSQYEDYLMQVLVFPTNSQQDEIKAEVIDYKTDGYGNLVSYPTRSGISGALNELKFSYPIKEFKKVGVKITPLINAKNYSFKLKKFDNTNFVNEYIVNISNDFVDNRPVEIFYDFETKLLSVQ